MKRLVALLLLASMPAATPAAATQVAVGRSAQTDVMVTVYNGNLGLVKDVRDVQLPAGVHEIHYADVASLIDPTSVLLKSLSEPAALRILEQNYEYDLLSADKLMEKYVGKKVRLYQPDGTYHEATLLSTAGPIFEINGQIHLGHHGRLVLPSLPENLVAKPTLVWLLRNQLAARQRVQASYLSGGLGWKADYVALFDEKAGKLDMQGWITLTNESGTTYTAADTKLVAGDVQLSNAGYRPPYNPVAGVRRAGTESNSGTGQALGDYYIYSPPERTTIAQNETKQQDACKSPLNGARLAQAY